MPRSSPKDRRDPGHRAALPRLLEGTGAGLCTRAGGARARLRREGAPGPGRAASARGGRLGLFQAFRWRARAWGGSRIRGASKGSPRLRGHTLKRAPISGNGGVRRWVLAAERGTQMRRSHAPARGAGPGWKAGGIARGADSDWAAGVHAARGCLWGSLRSGGVRLWEGGGSAPQGPALVPEPRGPRLTSAPPGRPRCVAAAASCFGEAGATRARGVATASSSV